KRSHLPRTLLARAATLTLAAFLFPRQQPIQSPAAAIPEEAFIVRTVPLSKSSILQTVSAASFTIESTPAPEIAFSTDHSQPLPSISDAELLALFPHKATALLRANEGKRFLFLDPKDAAEFLASVQRPSP